MLTWPYDTKDGLEGEEGDLTKGMFQDEMETTWW